MGLFSNIFSRNNKPKPASASIQMPVVQPKKSKYEFLNIKVAGVTFKNGRKSRQTILRKIKFRDPPFEHEADIDIRKYEFEGEPAIGIFVNSEQIGNVPKNQVQYLLDNWSRTDSITAINIYGGGKTELGESRNYGAEVTIRLLNEEN